MADPLDLDALEALLAASTPLPWFVEHPFSRRIIRGPETGYGPAQVARCNVERNAVAEVDAALIAAVVNALPAHIAEIRRLRAALAKHGRHESGCYWLARDRNGEVRAVRLPCSCGLAKELEAG